MIIFLTLCYIALLAILVKLGVIKLTFWWKISPLVWGLLLLLVLFLPMQWGSPAGDLLVLNYVVEIIPNVSGEVTEVPAIPLVPVTKGDVLFQIDRRPFQAEVDRLEAALAAAEQNVPQLKTAFQAAAATLDQLVAQRDLAKLNYDRALSIQNDNPGAISQLQVDQSRQSLAAAEAAVKAGQANKEQARLAWKQEINGENTQVAELRAQLAAAQLNLDWTTVRAPADGTVVSLFLRPGQRVANFPVRSWLAYLERDATRIAVAVPQYVLRHVKPGQPVEVVLKLRPGRTFAATVESIAPLNSEGQIQASGVVPKIGAASASEQRFVVIVNFDDENIEPSLLSGGAAGTAAIYTDSVRMTHVIRRIMVRMQTWVNYILP
jgi:multidrug resistance efflux pump